VKHRKTIALCAAVLCAGGLALAQDAGYQPPINSGLNLPIPKGNPGTQGFYTGNGASLATQANPPAPKSRTDGMTVEQIAAAIESVRVQKAELEKWERELMVAAQSKVIAQRERLAKLGVTTDLPPAPSSQMNIFSFGNVGLYGGQ